LEEQKEELESEVIEHEEDDSTTTGFIVIPLVIGAIALGTLAILMASGKISKNIDNRNGSPRVGAIPPSEKTSKDTDQGEINKEDLPVLEKKSD